MSVAPAPDQSSPRREQLLDGAYAHVQAGGLAGMSLRPLATAIGSSPRVLLFLFGSKDGLVRALLGRARADELAFLERARGDGSLSLIDTAREVWRWLAADEHRALLRLWTESYARSLIEPEGPWGAFAARTVADWLELLADAQPPARRRSQAGQAQRTLVLALLRGAMLDLLATGDVERCTRAVELGLTWLDSETNARPRRGHGGARTG
jgi:AcrR family transcriptional regulator